jgi:superfamily II DNA helicase RecQ
MVRISMANALYENRFVSIYHAGLSSNDQKNILQHFVISDSVIRFVICTVAFGLGVNISDVRIVMHWGVSEYVLQYWQEVGRAGRDGQKATAYMYATKPKMCNGINNGSISCFRQAILECMIPVKKLDIKCEGKCETCECSMCNCCNLCKSYCPCHKC